LRRAEKLPRRPEFACPVCKSAPPIGNYWRCGQCGQPFDMFVFAATCPYCHAVHDTVGCPDCGEARPYPAWDASVTDV